MANHLEKQCAAQQCECHVQMLDIPLNVRYDIAVKPAGHGSIRWFVTGGITNYVMLREYYDYKFANPKDPNIRVWTFDSQTTSVKTEKYFWVGALNLSAGYERSLTRRIFGTGRAFSESGRSNPLAFSK